MALSLDPADRDYSAWVRAAPLSSDDRQPVITGLGLVTALGDDVSAVHAALCAGRHGLSAAPGGGLEARVPDAPFASEMALRAARQATATLSDCRQLWVIAGTTAADLGRAEPSWQAWSQATGGPAPDLWLQLGHRPAAVVQRALGSHGPAWGVSTACTSGAVALIQAADLIADGQATQVLALGVDALCQMTRAGFAALGLRASGRSRPFDLHRDGLVLGEGAAALLVESQASARARGARPLAALVGAGLASDGHSLSAPHPQGAGLQRAIGQAMGSDRRRPDFVIAHGTGTRQNDKSEAIALNATLAGVAITATKGALGHCLGAAAAIDAVLLIQSLATGRLPGIVGLRQSDYSVNLVHDTIHGSFSSGLCTSAAFGGGSCALLFSGGDAPPR